MTPLIGNFNNTSYQPEKPDVSEKTRLLARSDDVKYIIHGQAVSQTLSCDDFDSGLDGWFVYSTYENPGTLVNSPGIMQLLGNSTRPSGVTVKKVVTATGQIDVTSVFTHFSPTTLHFWVEYADGDTTSMFNEGTTSSTPQVHIIENYRTLAGKRPVALYFYAAVSQLFPPFRIDIDKVCVTQSVYLPVIIR